MDAARATPRPVAGMLVGGRYRIGEPLGEGGMGIVLAAHDEREKRDVALKLLQVVGESNIERFLREARLATKVESEHTVRVLDVGALGHSPFLIMERLHGEDFGAKVRTRALRLGEVADCVLQTCDALAYAHGAGIVHRDIKASNLFEHCQADGARIVKVLDFGISKMFATSPLEVERTLTRTRDGGFLGSPPYMSPEHVRDPRNVDGRADIWSLGVVAYRLLSTRFPFPGETTGEVLAAILERRPARLRSYGLEIPDEVETIIDRCLARDRDERFADAGMVARAFAPYGSARWQSYGTRVPEIVSRGTVASPAESSRTARKKKVREPSTQTVPPPAGAIEEQQKTLALDPQIYRSARSVTSPSTSPPASAASVPPPVESVRSPLDVSPSAEISLVAAPPKSRTGAILIALGLVVAGVVAVVAILLSTRPPAAASSSTSPASSTPAPEPPASVASAAPTTSAAPTVASATPEPISTKPPAGRDTVSGPTPKPPPRGRPGGPSKPAPPPAAPPATSATVKKPELERNPYGNL